MKLVKSGTDSLCRKRSIAILVANRVGGPGIGYANAPGQLFKLGARVVSPNMTAYTLFIELDASHEAKDNKAFVTEDNSEGETLEEVGDNDGPPPDVGTQPQEPHGTAEAFGACLK